jgi:hypothetical protein
MNLAVSLPQYQFASHKTIGRRESGALTHRAFEAPDLMAQSQDLELEVKARTKDRTQCDEKCEQGSGHRRREFDEQYDSFPLRSFQIFERHSREPTPPTGSRSECPIFDVQFGDPSELSRVVRNQPHAKTAGMGRNEQVVRADHRAKSL